MAAGRNRGVAVCALEIKTVSARERTRRARGGAATHIYIERDRRLYTPHRATKKFGLIGRDQPSNEAVQELEIHVGSIKREKRPLDPNT